MDRDGLLLQLDNLRHQAGMQRWTTSRAVQASVGTTTVTLLHRTDCCRLLAFVTDQQKVDNLIHAPEKRNNPWHDKVKSGNFKTIHSTYI